MKGRILIDVPQTGHTCGEYVDIDKNTANALIHMRRGRKPLNRNPQPCASAVANHRHRPCPCRPQRHRLARRDQWRIAIKWTTPEGA